MEQLTIDTMLRRARWTPERRARQAERMVGNRHAKDAPVIGECWACLQPATTWDHLIPRGRPGWADPRNLAPMCRWCQSSKSNRTPDEWLQAGLYAATDEHLARRRGRRNVRRLLAAHYRAPTDPAAAAPVAPTIHDCVRNHQEASR